MEKGHDKEGGRGIKWVCQSLIVHVRTFACGKRNSLQQTERKKIKFNQILP